MAYEPLHHKYRPQTFAELVGQAAVATTLTNALRQQKIAPAYLFTGARGTGKTSSARILAKSLNCLTSNVPTETPCGQCEVCRSIANGSALDVIEIDAASNTGVDNIRELIERAQFAPVQCRYKVYVIDECHMLSTAAFNALLKTLEEPPNHVVFVLATTDPQRVLPTIISRCQRFDFRRIELEAMVQHLGEIATKEAIDIAPEAIQLVAQIAQGGLRDAESMLDQLSLLDGQIVNERVWDLVGAVPERDLLAIVQAIVANHPTSVIDRVRHLMDRGREPLIVLQNLASFYRDLLIAKTTPNRNDLVAVTPPTWAEMVDLVQSLDIRLILKGQQHLRSSEAQVKNTTQPRLWLEVTLLGLLPTSSEAAAPQQNAETSLPKSVPLPVVAPPAATPVAPSPVVPSSVAQPSATSAAPAASITPAPPIASPPVVAPIAKPAVAASPSEPEPAVEPSVVAPPAEVPPAPLTETIPAASAQTVDLEQVWQSIVEVLQPPGTQALFKQQGRLLALGAGNARVGISSQPLFKMAQLRIANLETAFAQLTQKPIRVSLEVVAQTVPASPEEAQAPQTAAQTTAKIATSPVPAEPIRASAKPTVKEPVSQNGHNQAVSNRHSQTVSEGSAAYEPQASKEPVASQATAETAPLPQPWQNEDDVSRAAKSLAQMFNGQVVRWDDELQAPVEEAAHSPTDLAANLTAEDGDPDDDVPF